MHFCYSQLHETLLSCLYSDLKSWLNNPWQEDSLTSLNEKFPLFIKIIDIRFRKKNNLYQPNTYHSHFVIVVPPWTFFWIFGTSFHIKKIIRRSGLFRCWSQHWQNWQTHWVNRQCWTPIGGQNWQANVPIAVNMRMLGNIVSCKCYNWRIKRIFFVKLKTQLKIFPFK